MSKVWAYILLAIGANHLSVHRRSKKSDLERLNKIQAENMRSVQDGLRRIRESWDKDEWKS